MSRIYTRKGDDGSTGLFGGGRVSKADLRVEAYGEVDELNAVLGWAIAVSGDSEIQAELSAIQSDLFAVGAQLADPGHDSRASKEKTRIDQARIEAFERRIDRAEEETGPVRQFILPGGAPAAAALHLARTVCRRAERRVVSLAGKETVSPLVVSYLNRLSDLLFALARLANRRAGVPDVPWV
jgi:cob(I)alamin adenosyltransferase